MLTIADNLARIEMSLREDAYVHFDIHVDYQVHEFRDSFDTVLIDAEETVRALRALHASSDGTVVLRDAGDDLTISFIANKGGNLLVAPRIRKRYPNLELSFEIELDQSYLPSIADGLRELR